MREMFPSDGGVPSQPDLLDKATWHQEADRQVATAEMHGTPLSVVFIDINAFKSINDELGHIAGDRFIEEIGGLVNFVTTKLRVGERSMAAEPDTVSFSRVDENTDASAGRVGGDEFAIIAQTDATGAQALVTRLRTEFITYRDQHPELEEIGVGLAIGASTFESGMTSSELLAEADQEMYKDKLEQLPPLNRKQEKLIRNIGKSGIRARDIEHYLRLLSDDD